MKRLFFGGIHPKYNKEMSTVITTFRTITPKQVVIPMQQHIGAPCTPLVAVGDRVLRGQKIGDGEGLCPAPSLQLNPGLIPAAGWSTRW